MGTEMHAILPQPSLVVALVRQGLTVEAAVREVAALEPILRLGEEIPEPGRRAAWTSEQVRARGPQVAEAWRVYSELVAARSRRIAAERADPLRLGWEPSIWWVADALLGLRREPADWPAVDGLGWLDWSERTRRALGFAEPLDLLLVSGPNRGGKSEWAAKRTMQLLEGTAGTKAWCFHESEGSSVEMQQKLIRKYMSPELRSRDIRTAREYITYREQTGFGDSHFILPNGSDCGFKFYKQDLRANEGGERSWVWCDELVGPDLVETLLSRIATLSGKLALTFTPVFGWNATVQLILQGAEVTRWTTAFLLPKDGGAPDVARGLGFGSEEEMALAHAEERWSVPEDCTRWYAGAAEEAAPEGRTFERMPRVMRCVRSGWGAIFFQPRDNPFGNPWNVWRQWREAGREKVERRLYGWARKAFSAQFPTFDEAVHVIPEDQIPSGGRDYMMLDPTPGGRPFVMGWFRVVDRRIYMVREWPDVEEVVPGLGALGLWAVPSGARNGQNDGKPGPAQDPIGWGLRQYILEIGRIEGWAEADLERARTWEPEGEESRARSAEGEVEGERGRRRLPPLIREERAAAEDELGATARVRVVERWIDCRPASAPRMEGDRARTLLTDFEDRGLYFSLTPGGEIVEKVAKVNDLLARDEAASADPERGYWAMSRLYFSSRCRNTIYAMNNWMNADGNKGACKDFCDLVLWAADLGLEEM